VLIYISLSDPNALSINAARAECFLAWSPHKETFTLNSEQARQRAERNFKREERALDSQKAMAEYETQARATREKTAALKALRLAKEAQTAIAL
jgi:hypothetical protein